MRFSFPIGYKERGCYLVPIDSALLPLVAGALRIYEAREAWQTRLDYEAAYNAFGELEALMTKLCLHDLVESNNRIYRLLDAGLFGQPYYVVNAEPLEIIPEIPLVPPGNTQLPGALARLQRIEHVIDNAINGTFYPSEYESSTAMRNQLADIIALLQQQSGSLDPDILAKLAEIAVLLA